MRALRNIVAFLSCTALTSIAYAQGTVIPVDPNDTTTRKPIPGVLEPNQIPQVSGSLGSVGNVFATACTVIDWLFTAAIVLSIAFIIIAAINYMQAGGNPKKLETANSMLKYTAIGIAVAIICRALPLLINALVGGGSAAGNAIKSVCN